MSTKLDLAETYKNYVNDVAGKFKSKDAAMENAIGGEFEALGIIEMEMLKYFWTG